MNGTNYLQIVASSVDMFKNKVDTSQEAELHTDEKMLDSR